MLILLLLLPMLLLPYTHLGTDNDDKDDQAQGTCHGDTCDANDFFHMLSLFNLVDDTFFATKIDIFFDMGFPLGVNTLKGKKKYAERKAIRLEERT